MYTLHPITHRARSSGGQSLGRSEEPSRLVAGWVSNEQGPSIEKKEFVRAGTSLVYLGTF